MTPKRFQRVFLWPGESRKVTFELSADDLKQYNDDGELVLDPGEFRITVGGACPHPRAVELGAPQPVSASLSVQG